MTRPAINYNTWITAPMSYVWYRQDGSVDVSGTYTGMVEWRYCAKPASIKTVPVAKGQFVAPTPYLCQWYRVSFGLTGVDQISINPAVTGGKYRYHAYGSGLDSTYNRVPNAIYAPPSGYFSQLEVKALNKLRNQRVNFGVAIAEAGQTAKLFESTVKRIASDVSAFKRRNPAGFLAAAMYEGKRTARNWKKIPNEWLEVQYGWNPLMSDVQGACEELMYDVRHKDPIIVVKSKKSYSTNARFTQNGQSASYVANVNCSVDLKVKLAYKLSNWILAELSRLGLANPAEIIWERVPYSFVVDWFLPVGQWLSALSGDFGYTFISGHKTTFVKMEESLDHWQPINPNLYSVLGPPVTGKGGYLHRQLYGSSPVPGLSFKSPVSATHIANGLSLLTNAFKLPRKR